jgi:hypothetical protein
MVLFDKVANSKNDEYFTPEYAIFPIIKYLERGKGVVWCPFDTEDSHYVKVLRLNGFMVVHSHLSTGQDFFTQPVPENCSYIISNPPIQKRQRCSGGYSHWGYPLQCWWGW